MDPLRATPTNSVNPSCSAKKEKQRLILSQWTHHLPRFSIPLAISYSSLDILPSALSSPSRIAPISRGSFASDSSSYPHASPLPCRYGDAPVITILAPLLRCAIVAVPVLCRPRERASKLPRRAVVAVPVLRPLLSPTPPFFFLEQS